MHIIIFPENNFKIYIPADLSECDSKQYINICGLLFDFHSQKISPSEMLTHAAYRLMNMVPKESKTLKDETNKLNNLILIEELIESTFFEKTDLDENGNYNLRIIQNYIANPVPFFKPLWKKYYGPTHAFQNIKCGEYVDCLRLFLQYNATGNFDLLLELAAALYRPKKRFHFVTKYFANYDGDCRSKYNIYHLERRVKALKSAPIGFIYGVYLYFASMQIFVSGAAVPWGDKTLDLSILFSGSNQDLQIEASDLGLDSVIFAMAESGAFGDFEKVQQTPFWTMMIKMYDARIKQLQLEKQQENANNQSPS